jgi:hypothetical protein
MKVGDKYRITEIGVREWRKLASTLRLGNSPLLTRVGEIARRIPDAIASLRIRAHREGLDHPTVDLLASELTARARLYETLTGD